MNLYIVLNTTIDNMITKDEPSLLPETVNIAGKELIEYWIEWALHKNYTTLCIYTERKAHENLVLQPYQDLYGIKIQYLPLEDKSMLVNDDETYHGMGIFMDTGEYRLLNGLGEVYLLEQDILFRPLGYGSQSGYSNDSHIQIGKNSYIHKSAKLSGAVVIGDNCIIEKDVEICDSVICSNTLIKRQSVIQNAHISKDIRMLSALHLKDKALYKSNIYSATNNTIVPHNGICAHR